jgi:hypothetical protein
MVGYKPDGKLDMRHAYGKTQKECQAALDAIRAQKRDGNADGCGEGP